MAARYETLGITGTVELLGGGKTQDASFYSFRALPSGATATLVITRVNMTPSNLRLIIPTVADALNTAAELDGVEDVNVYQDVNSAGQFVTKMDVDVTSSSGRSSETIHPPYGSIFDARFADAVSAARGNLDAIEGL
jgi:hypothetical protein